MLLSLFKLAVGILLLSFTTNTIAETLQSFTLPLSYQVEGNPRLFVNDSLIESVNRVILVPAYSLMIDQGTEQIFANASLHIERSSNQIISEDRNDPSINIGWLHEYSKGQFDISALVIDRSTRESEFDQSSIVRFDNTRQNRSLLFNWLQSLGARTSITLNTEATNVGYAKQTIGLSDFKYGLIGATWSYTTNGQVDIFTTFSYIGYMSDGTNTVRSNESNAESIDIGIKWTVNEKVDITSSIGLNQRYQLLGLSNSSAVYDESTIASWQGLLNIQYMTLRTNTQLGITKGLSPLSSGIVETNQLRVAWNYSLTERQQVGFNFGWRERLERIRIRTMNILANYIYEITPSWDFILTAENRNRVDSSNLATAYSNSLMISIVYKIPEF